MVNPGASGEPADGLSLAPGKPGVLIVNLGTPAAPTARAVREYLAEFLSDPRIIDTPRALWLPLLHGVILNVRPRLSAKAYAAIWRTDTNESPLRRFTRLQAERLKERIGAYAVVDWAVRYGAPSISDGLARLRAAGASRICVLPLYPQYSETTNLSVADAVTAAAGRSPAVTLGGAFFDHPKYIAALKAEASRFLSSLQPAPERLVMSFHGLPQRYVDRGDPYYKQCAATSSLLREAMGWSEEFAPMTFQSKFGPGRWLGPSTEKTLARLAREGVRHVAVMTPGFVSDCIETLEEIAIRARETFVENGGATLTARPCLNDSDAMIDILEALAVEAIGGGQ